MFNIPEPDTQIAFAAALGEMRRYFLQEALSATVKNIDVRKLNKELDIYVNSSSLSLLASIHLRGELVFPVPVVLTENPRLLGYYRLLYGFSQKSFYATGTNLSKFQSMEKRGTLSASAAELIGDLCKALSEKGTILLNGIHTSKISLALLDDLTLLTLGPQLKGGENVRKGLAAIHAVFGAIHSIVDNAVKESAPDRIIIENAAGRSVLIEFAPDPDIVIREKMTDGGYLPVLAIEVKGGSDFSNIHNRIGEAEKSHQKARSNGYNECWTVVNVDKIDIKMSKRESPSTNRFYRISDLVSSAGKDYQDFRARIISLTGIRET